MIDPAAPPLLSLGGAMPGMPVELAADSGENGGFAGLLALELSAPAMADKPAMAAEAGLPGPAATLPHVTLPLMPDATLPESGNSLPVGLPVTAPEPNPEAKPAEGPLIAGSLITLPKPKVQTVAADLSEAAPQASEPQALLRSQPVTGQAHALRAQRAGHPQLTDTDAEPEPGTGPEASDSETPDAQTIAAQPAPVMPAAVFELRLPAFLRQSAGEPAPARPVMPQQLVQPDPEAATKGAAQPSVIAPIAQMFASRRVTFEPVKEPQQPGASVADLREAGHELRIATPASQTPVVTTTQAAMPPSVEPAQLLPAQSRGEAPADFAQIVDRLIAARQAVAPAEVRVSIDHAQFGKVSLAFAPDQTGLNVTLASADPDFARAVEAAGPVSAPPAPGETAMNTGGQSSRQGEASSAFAGGQGQSAARHSSADPRGSDTRTANPSQGETRTPYAERRRGIFA